MKKVILLCLAALLALSLCACSLGSCHRCGKALGSNPIKAGGRSYCSYNCYMTEMLFD